MRSGEVGKGRGGSMRIELHKGNYIYIRGAEKHTYPRALLSHRINLWRAVRNKCRYKNEMRWKKGKRKENPTRWETFPRAQTQGLSLLLLLLLLLLFFFPYLSGSICLWINPEIVGPNVFSWSLPIQIKNQLGLWIHVDSAAPIPVPVQIRTPRL